MEDGLLKREGDGYFWTGHNEVKSQTKEVSGALVTYSAPAWLVRLGKTGVGDGSYNPVRPVQRVMCAFKIALGIPFDDRAWDKAQYPRYARAAQKLLDAFKGDDEKAGYWIQDAAMEFKDEGLSWTLDTLASRAWDTVPQREYK